MKKITLNPETAFYFLIIVLLFLLGVSLEFRATRIVLPAVVCLFVGYITYLLYYVWKNYLKQGKEKDDGQIPS